MGNCLGAADLDQHLGVESGRERGQSRGRHRHLTGSRNGRRHGQGEHEVEHVGGNGEGVTGGGKAHHVEEAMHLVSRQRGRQRERGGQLARVDRDLHHAPSSTIGSINTRR